MVGTKADQGNPSLVGACLVLSSGMIQWRVARDLDRRATATSQLCLVADPGSVEVAGTDYPGSVAAFGTNTGPLRGPPCPL